MLSSLPATMNLHTAPPLDFSPPSPTLLTVIAQSLKGEAQRQGPLMQSQRSSRGRDLHHFKKDK